MAKCKGYSETQMLRLICSRTVKQWPDCDTAAGLSLCSPFDNSSGDGWLLNVKVKLITGLKCVSLFRNIPFASLDTLSSSRSSQSSTALSSQGCLSSLLFVGIGFKTTPLSVNLYPRHIDLMVSDSLNCWNDPALFYRPEKRFPGGETDTGDLLV